MNANANPNPFNRGRYPSRPRPLRPHPFRVGMQVGDRVVATVTTTRVILECKCGCFSAVTIRRLEKEQPQTCRHCAPRLQPGTRGAVTEMRIGDRFGSRVVTGVLVRSNAEGGVLVEVRCDCGHEGTAEPRMLKAGRAQSCTRCANPLRGQPLAKRVLAGGRSGCTE